MFDIGWGELVVIGIVALIAIGPKELPAVLRTIGTYMGKIRRMAGEFQGQFQEAMREAEMADLKKQADDLTSSVSNFTSYDPMADVRKGIESVSTSEPAATDAAATTPSAEAASPPPIDVPPPAAPDAPAAPPKPAGSGG